MPRPKVLPANRLRAPEACLACRASKKRCSGTFPCSKCIRNGRADTCVPFRRPNNASSPRQTNDAYRALTSPDAGRRTRNTSNGPRALPQLLPAVTNTSGAPHKTHSRMLRSRQGERGTELGTPHKLLGYPTDGHCSLHRQGRIDILLAATSRYGYATHRSISVLT